MFHYETVNLVGFPYRSLTQSENGVQWPNESLYNLNGDLFDVGISSCVFSLFRYILNGRFYNVDMIYNIYV